MGVGGNSSYPSQFFYKPNTLKNYVFEDNILNNIKIVNENFIDLDIQIVYNMKYKRFEKEKVPPLARRLP